MLNRLTKLREERTERENGFTLIELLVVVVIIGILIAIAIPLYLNYQKGANDKSAQSDVRGAVAVLEQCNSDNGSYPTGPTGAGAFVGTPTGCTGTVNVSKNSALTYAPNGVTPPTGYTLTGTNSSGSGKVYCYDSANGGAVTALTGGAITC
ncbi:MAG TPA: prepilin-type N-terminal cleavage/methylation domain-containing protein [Jatrophihabitans sp.]|jgi:type IV pilus assembly protein PilA